MQIKNKQNLQIRNIKFSSKNKKDIIINYTKPHISKNIPTNIEFYKTYQNIGIITPKFNNIDFEKIKQLGITNLKQVENKGFRGESLSADRNNKYLPQIKNYGINTIIDLRTSDYTEKFKHKCENLGFNYYHIPIDSKTISDREIINNLPSLFKKLDDGNFYIACAQGKHRTDIALALNYLFNPKYKGNPPTMHGHIENGKMRTQDIFTRANSIYKELNNNDKNLLGWNKEFDENFKIRKQKLVEFNED